MELLDAALALVLTLGALGTIVTMLMELMFRVFCIRARFLKGMIQDYVLPEVMSIPAIKAAFAAVTGDAPTAQTAKAAERKLVEAIIGNPAEKVSLDRPVIGPGGAYDRITLEHFLSRLVEETGLRERIDTARAEVRAALIESARIFDKMSGATVASFATRARGWSLVIGIILAFVANVDGLRLFETYRDSPETALAIIADQDGLAAADADATASFRAALALEAEVRVLEEKIKSANETEKAAAEEALVAKRAGTGETGRSGGDAATAGRIRGYPEKPSGPSSADRLAAVSVLPEGRDGGRRRTRCVGPTRNRIMCSGSSACW